MRTTGLDDASMGSKRVRSQSSEKMAEQERALRQELSDEMVDASDDEDDEAQGVEQRARLFNRLRAFGDVVEGETYMIVSAKWLQALERYLAQQVDIPPGPIDQSDIVDEVGTGDLLPNLEEGTDYEVVSTQLWSAMRKWYATEDVVEIARSGIAIGDNANAVEVYVPCFAFCEVVAGGVPNSHVDEGRAPRAYMSKTASVGELITSARESLGIYATVPIRLWQLPVTGAGPPRKISAATLAAAAAARTPTARMLEYTSESEQLKDVSLVNDAWLAVEQKRLGEWTTASARPSSSASTAPSHKRHVSGAIGLSNLGNTCYMNSALQCLSHTPELAEYFRSGAFKSEINDVNPLGMHGQVAEAYAKVCDHLYASDHGFFSPREFKSLMGHYNSSFAGYMQQDSQEFLVFLLDSLHEDLNRVYAKPYTERPELESDAPQTVLDIAAKSWQNHLLRNNSVIVDLFTGLFKSTLVCPECAKVSITFDPYTDITLPLPVQRKWTHEVVFVPAVARGSLPVKVTVVLSKNASMRELFERIGKIFDVPVTRLVGSEVCMSRIFRHYSNPYERVDACISTSDDAYFFELDRDIDEQNHEVFAVPVIHKSAEAKHRHAKNCGMPFFITLTKHEASSPEAVYEKIALKAQQFTSRKDLVRLQAPTDADDDSTRPSERPSDFTMSIMNRIGEQMATGWSYYRETSLKDRLAELRKGASLDDAEASEGDNDEDDESVGDDVASDRNSNDMSMRDVSSDDSSDGDYNNASLFHSTADLDASQQPIAVVQPGEGVACVWRKWDRAFSDDADASTGQALWDDTTTTTDPDSEPESADKLSLTLDKCLDEFSRPERLGQDDPWYCPSCKEFRQAEKTLEIWTLPDIMIFCLKRFSNVRHFRDKIDDLIEFPAEGLDMSSRVGALKMADLAGIRIPDADKSYEYDLFAVDNHFGGLGGGHYTAYAKNFGDGKFYNFDDSRVSGADPAGIVTSAAYLLFYRRRSSKPLGGSKLADIIASARARAAADGPHAGHHGRPKHAAASKTTSPASSTTETADADLVSTRPSSRASNGRMRRMSDDSDTTGPDMCSLTSSLGMPSRDAEPAPPVSPASSSRDGE